VWWVGRACRSPQPYGLVVIRSGPSVTRWCCFWRSDVPGHSIAGGVWGSVGCGQQLPGGGGPSGAYADVCSRRGRGWIGSLAVCAGHTSARGPGRFASRSPRPLGIVVAVYASRNSRPPGGGGPVGMCVGTCSRLGGVVVGGWQPGQGSCCSRGVGGCGLG